MGDRDATHQSEAIALGILHSLLHLPPLRTIPVQAPDSVTGAGSKDKEDTEPDPEVSAVSLPEIDVCVWRGWNVPWLQHHRVNREVIGESMVYVLFLHHKLVIDALPVLACDCWDSEEKSVSEVKCIVHRSRLIPSSMGARSEPLT